MPKQKLIPKAKLVPGTLGVVNDGDNATVYHVTEKDSDGAVRLQYLTLGHGMVEGGTGGYWLYEPTATQLANALKGLISEAQRK